MTIFNCIVCCVFSEEGMLNLLSCESAMDMDNCLPSSLMLLDVAHEYLGRSDNHLSVILSQIMLHTKQNMKGLVLKGLKST